MNQVGSVSDSIRIQGCMRRLGEHKRYRKSNRPKAGHQSLTGSEAAAASPATACRTNRGVAGSCSSPETLCRNRQSQHHVGPGGRDIAG